MMKQIRLTLLLICFGLALSMAHAQSWPGGIHDPSSIVKDGDTYWIFGTGDGIHCMYSKDMITWQDGPSPFSVSKYDSNGTTIVTGATYPSWINDYVHGAEDTQGNPVFHGGFWAPDIIYMNDKYYLYYSCSEWGTMTSTVGCVTNKTLDPDSPDYKWEDVGFLGIWSYQPGLALNAIDPAMLRGHDGKIWMIYGSFNREGIVVTEVDSVSGKPKTYTGNLPGTSIANSWTGGTAYGEGEGGSMIYRDGYYYLFYNKGGCCAGIASTYYMVMGRSTSPRGPFYDKSGAAMRQVGATSGGTIVFKHDNSRGQEDRYYGPGHFGMYRENGVDYVTFHYYDPNGYYPNADANYQGGPTLGLAKLDWGEDGWPSISLDFLEEGVYDFENQQSGKFIDVQSHNPINGASLYQYAEDTTQFNQKWIFKSLGTGEYTIQNYANPEVYVEASGNYGNNLTLTSEYTESINQKFRTVTSPKGYTYIYPSTEDIVWGLKFPTNSDIAMTMQKITGVDHQRWMAMKFEETFNLSESSVTLDYTAQTYKGLIVESNGMWEVDIANRDWITVEGNGEKTDTLKITVTENTATSSRKIRMYLESRGGVRLPVIITQEEKPVSTNDIHANELFTAYPNPSKGNLTLELEQNATIEVFNQTGQLIKQVQTTSGIHTWNIADWTNGVYLIRVSTENNSVVKKVIKQ